MALLKQTIAEGKSSAFRLSLPSLRQDCKATLYICRKVATARTTRHSKKRPTRYLVFRHQGLLIARSLVDVRFRKSRALIAFACWLIRSSQPVAISFCQRQE